MNFDEPQSGMTSNGIENSLEQVEDEYEPVRSQVYKANMSQENG